MFRLLPSVTVGLLTWTVGAFCLLPSAFCTTPSLMVRLLTPSPLTGTRIMALNRKQSCELTRSENEKHLCPRLHPMHINHCFSPKSLAHFETQHGANEINGAHGSR